MTDSMSKIKDYFVNSSGLASVSIWLAAMLTLPLFVFAAAAAFASVQLVFGAVSGALVLVAPKATDGEIRLMLGALDSLDALRFCRSRS